MTSSSISRSSTPRGRAGYAGLTDDVRSGDLTPMFETIVDHVPPPRLDADGPFKMLVTLLDRDPFLGRILTGRIESGTLDVNMPIKAIDIDGNVRRGGPGDQGLRLPRPRAGRRSSRPERATSSPSPA